MEGDRFDALTRTLTPAVSRRATLGGLAAGVLSALGLALDGAPASAKKKKCPPGKVRCGGRCKECCADARCRARYGDSFGVCENGRCVECSSRDPFRGAVTCQSLWGDDFPYCVGATCVDRCRNRAPDGDESDVDCGGSCPTKCADGKGCFDHPDCQSGFCDNGTCATNQRGTCDGTGDASTPVIDDEACPEESRCGGGDCWCTATAGGERRCLNHSGTTCFDDDDCAEDGDCPAGQFCAKVAGCCGHLTLRRACLPVCDE